MSKKGHSEEYFGEERDFWWNNDYFELLAKRWELNKYSKLLDVGCGCCHWSKLFCNYLKQPAQIYALDYDSKWAKGNETIREYFTNRNVEINFLQGDAERLPFPDETFDIVTCQTVLIHIKNPMNAIKEMKRILKKGGIIICAEPNNSAGVLVRNSLLENESVEETLERVKYHLMYEAGKKLVGDGDNSIGDFLPIFFAKQGLKEIKTFLSDKASPSFPACDSEEEIATLNTLKQWVKNTEGELDYEQERKYFMAINAEQKNIDFFNQQYEKNKLQLKLRIDDIEKKQFYSGGASIMYIVSGIKD